RSAGFSPLRMRSIQRPMSALGHSRHSRHPGVSGSPPKADIRPVRAFMSTRPSPTLAELLMPLPAANPFSTMRASLRWYSSEELEDGVTYGGQSWLRRGSVDSFFSALLLRDGDAAGRRKRSSS